MGWFDLDSDIQSRIDAMPTTTDVPPAGALEGVLTSIPKGVVGATAKLSDLSEDFLDTDAGQVIGMALPWARAAHNVMSPEMRENASAATKVAAEWAATGQDPRKTGTVGRILAGTSEGLTIGLAGSAVAGPWGAAGLLGTTEGYAQYKDARAQGVDHETAKDQALVTGLFSAAGALLPLKYGKTLASGLLGGAAVNVGLGGLQRHLTSEVLESGGYHEMASQYRIADGEAVAADLILGSAFGAFGHATARKVNPADVDAAAAVAAEDHFNRSAPGVPTDPVTATAHADTMAAALRSLADGDLPDIPPERAQQLVDNVVADPAREAMADLHETAQIELPGFESAAADIKPIEMAPEEVPDAPWSGQSGGKGSPLDTFHDEMLGHLVHNYGDEFYAYRRVEDEQGTRVEAVTYRQIAQELQRQRDEAELFAELHEVAGACAARNNDPGRPPAAIQSGGFHGGGVQSDWIESRWPRLNMGHYND